MCVYWHGLCTLDRRRQTLGIVIVTHLAGLTARLCTLQGGYPIHPASPSSVSKLCAPSIWSLLGVSGRLRLSRRVVIIAKDSRGNLAQGPARDRRPKRAKQQPQRCPGRGELCFRNEIGGSFTSASSVPQSLPLRQSQNSDPLNLIYLRRKATLPVTRPHSRIAYAEHLFQVS